MEERAATPVSNHSLIHLAAHPDDAASLYICCAKHERGGTVSTLTVSGVEVPVVPTGLFIGGTWREAGDGATFDVIAPSSEEHLATVAAASEQDIDDAVASALAQFDGGRWSALTGAERGMLLFRLADLIERDIEILATLEALDVGKPAVRSAPRRRARTRSTSFATSRAGRTRSRAAGSPRLPFLASCARPTRSESRSA